MRTRTAACACGALVVRSVGEPDLVSLCHCRQCQRRTGSAFGLAAFYDRARVTVEGAARMYRRRSDSGFDVVFHFCAQCGSTVYWEPMRKPEAIAIAVGCFAEHDFPPPSKAVYEANRHRWFTLPI